MSRPPSTMVRRLLKSCATPPVSWPTASIFCAWRSDSSTFLRASFSASSSRVRSLTASSEGFGEIAQLDQLALALGDVDADADDADRLSSVVVERQAPRLDPAQLVVAWPHDPKFELEFAHLFFESRCDRIAQPDHVLAVNGCDPAVVAAVECRRGRTSPERSATGARCRPAPASRSRRRGRSVRREPEVRRFRRD